MTNQAAQTMPEPDAYCAPYEPNNAVAFAWPGTDRAPMHIAPLYCQQKVVDAYQQGYAAALSQTAGVAEVARVCKWHQQDEGYDTFSTGCGHEYTVNECTDGNVQLPYCPFCAKPLIGIAWNEDDDVSLSEALSSPDAAAPAASGGESVAPVPYEQHEREILKVIDQRDHREVVIDRILDTVLGTDRPEWSSAYSFADAINDVADRMVDLEIKAAKNTTPPAAASVSERAREYRHSTHHVNRGPESLPCYCAATSDHLVGEEASNGEALARRFHEAYERLAPSFGYETRTETRQFDPTTPNGRLMIAVCSELALEQALTQQRGSQLGDFQVAWDAVCEALNLVSPEWTNNGQTGLQSAVITIQKLAAATPQPSADAVREIYDAAAKGFHTSETNGAERKYLHVIRFQSIEDLHGYEDAWTAAMVKARDAK